MTSINLLTLNCYIFPPLISYFGSKLGKDHERVQKIADTILSMENPPEVLTFQEMWSNQKRDLFYTKVKAKYPYHFEDPHNHPLTIGSGLAIYSKHPIEKTHLERFTHYRGDELFANKGFLIAKIVKDLKPMYIITTHLQAGAAPYDKCFSPYAHLTTTEIRFEQLKQIQKALEKFAHDDGLQKVDEIPIFFTGDLNIGLTEEEYVHIGQAFPNAINTLKKSSITGTSYDDQGRPKNNVIDHIFSLGKKILGHSAIITDIDYSQSDHLAVQGSYLI